MKKLILSACLFFCAPPCFALLSPLNQSLEEIQSIVQSTELQKYFTQALPIIEIQHSGQGYILKTEKESLVVEIQYIPIERPGRQQFKLIFHQPVPIQR